MIITDENIIKKEKILEILEECILSLRDISAKDDIYKRDLENTIHNIRITLHLISNEDIYIKTISFLERDVHTIMQKVQLIRSKETKDIGNLILDLNDYVINLRTRCLINKRIIDNKIPEYNSSKFVSDELNSLKKQKEELEQKISDVSQENINLRNSLQKELAANTARIKKTEQEKYIIDKQRNAQEELKNRISASFVILKKKSQPIEDEHKRLKRRYNTFSIGICLAFITLIILEIILYSKFDIVNPKWINYLPFYMPIPMCGGLLWVCIVQTNREQRILMCLANQLQHIGYIEGLLLAINNISANVQEGSVKIKEAMDNMINNYLNVDNNIYNDNLEKEVSKDSPDLKRILDILKDIKEIALK